jgi:nitrogen fixation protein NifB
VAAKQAAVSAVRETDAAGSLLVAIATKGGGRVNEHFGHAREFQVYEASPKGISFVGHRKVEQYCLGGFGEDATLDGAIEALEGIDVVLCAKIGDCPKDSLKAAGIRATDAYGFDYIETAIGALYAAEFGLELLAESA